MGVCKGLPPAEVQQAMTDEKQAWERMSREPKRWYTIFITYYIAGGFSRSVRAAWLGFLEANEPDKLDDAMSTRGVPKTWHAIAARWNWHERANAWEEHQSDLSLAAVEAASRMLRTNAPAAVDALVTALVRDKEAVRAAAEILNRGGLPAVNKQEVDSTVTLSSDDMREAQEELEEWESAKKKPK